MGKYLDIVRKAVEDYREEQTKRLAAERQEKISEIEEIVLQRYSDKLKGEAGSLDKLITKLEAWNPHFTATRDVIEEAVWAATQRLAEGETPNDVSEQSAHVKLPDTNEEYVEPESQSAEHTGMGDDIQVKHESDDDYGQEQPERRTEDGRGRLAEMEEEILLQNCSDKPELSRGRKPSEGSGPTEEATETYHSAGQQTHDCQDGDLWGDEPEAHTRPETRVVTTVGVNPIQTKVTGDSGGIGLAKTAGEYPERITETETAMRRGRISVLFPHTFEEYMSLGVFDELGFVPTEQEIEQASQIILEEKLAQGDAHRAEYEALTRPLGPLERDGDPLQDGGVWYTAWALQSIIRDNYNKRPDIYRVTVERNPVVLIDAVAASSSSFFLPTLEDMVEAMKMIGLEPTGTLADTKAEDSLPEETPAGTISEVERAIRRAQRALPTPLPSGRFRQTRVQFLLGGKPDTLLSNCYYHTTGPYTTAMSIPEVISELQEKGYLDHEPSESEVREVLHKLVEELRRAGERHEQREEERRRKATAWQGAVDQLQAADHQIEHEGVGTTPEADEPEIEIEGQPPKEPAGFDPYGDDEFEMDQVVRVAEVLREHRERCTSDADDLIAEGFFRDKLDFDPTPGIVEEAQCMLLLPEE